MAYLTTDGSLGTATCVLRFQDDDGLRWAIRGALYELAKEHNWQQLGTMTPAEAAEAMRVAVEAMIILPEVPIVSHVERSGSQALTDEPTQKIQWNNVIEDDDGLFDAVNFEWTIPYDGLWQVTVYASTFNDGSAFRLYEYTNNAESLQIARGVPVSGGDSALSHTTYSKRFEEGDVIDFRINPSKATNFNSSTASPCYAMLVFLTP